MTVIGITGNSGTGKSTLSKILNEYEEIKIIDADKIVKEMSIPGTEYSNAIKNTFGKEVFLEDGNLNREKLAQKIYNDNLSRQELNNLTFNYVVKEIVARIEKINSETIKYVVIDAPLLFESQLNKYCDYVIALISEFELKVSRICKRDNIDEETAKKRLSIQEEDSYYKEKSDFVIYNNNDCNLELEIKKIFKKLEK